MKIKVLIARSLSEAQLALNIGYNIAVCGIERVSAVLYEPSIQPVVDDLTKQQRLPKGDKVFRGIAPLSGMFFLEHSVEQLADGLKGKSLEIDVVVSSK